MILYHHQWGISPRELYILQMSHTFCCSLSLSSLELISFCCSSTNADSCTSCFLCSSSSVSCSSILSSYCSSFCFCLSLNSPAISDMRAAAPARSLLNACTTSPWLSASFLAWPLRVLKTINLYFRGLGPSRPRAYKSSPSLLYFTYLVNLLGFFLNVTYFYSFIDCEQSLFSFRFSEGSARARERRAEVFLDGPMKKRDC